MKITFVLPDMGISGGARVVFEYANRLTERGHNVHIVYPIIPPMMVSRSKMKFIETKVMGALANTMKYNRLSWFDLNAEVVAVPTISPKYTKLINSLIPNSDAVIATSWETAYFVNDLPKEKGEKYYFVQHYEIWDIWNNLKCWDEAKKIEKNLNKLPIAMSYISPKDLYLKRLKELVDATYTMPLKKITISSWLKELLEKRFKQKVCGVITNGVNINEFHCDKNKNWDANQKIILILCRGVSWKGDLDNLKALDIVKKEYGENIEIHGFGWNENLNLPNYIKFHGILRSEELRELYCKAHIFVVPSWVEGCQLPPMEAMACKCAVVATNVGGVPDYAIPNKTAMVVPPQKPEDIAEKIIYLLDNPEELKRIGEMGHEHIIQFTWESATEKFENILHK